MIVMTPVTADGATDPRFGRAHWVAVADVVDGGIAAWAVHEVSWDDLHDAGTHGAHHARIMRFLLDNKVEAVVATEMGPGMVKMLDSAKLPVLVGSHGDAKESILAATDPQRAASAPAKLLGIQERHAH
mgnify:CR=1 FL=1